MKVPPATWTSAVSLSHQCPDSSPGQRPLPLHTPGPKKWASDFFPFSLQPLEWMEIEPLSRQKRRIALGPEARALRSFPGTGAPCLLDTEGEHGAWVGLINTQTELPLARFPALLHRL